MDRLIFAYSLIAALLAAIIGAFFYLRHHSRERADRRQRDRDEAAYTRRIEDRQQAEEDRAGSL